MKSKLVYLVTGMVLASTGFAVARDYVSTSGWPFYAPNVADEQDLNNTLDAGDIVYDENDGAFYGKVGAGNSWKEFGATADVESPESVVVSIASAFIQYTSGTPATVREDGNWISSITDTATGDMIINLNSVFSSVPNCTVSPEADDVGVSVDSTSTTTLHVEVWNTNTGSNADADFSIICVGQKS